MRPWVVSVSAGVCVGGGGGGNVKGGYECVSPAVDDVTLREHKYI